MERLWRDLDGADLMPGGLLPGAVAMARRGEAIHGNDGLRRALETHLVARRFEDLQIPFQCVATDVSGVREVWFDAGPLLEPILASSAIPAVYPAVEIDGIRYLDGAIVDEVPMTRAVELGARTLYVLQVSAFARPRREPRRPLDVAVQSFWLARHFRFKRELASMPEGRRRPPAADGRGAGRALQRLHPHGRADVPRLRGVERLPGRAPGPAGAPGGAGGGGGGGGPPQWDR